MAERNDHQGECPQNETRAMPDEELLDVTEGWFRENTDGASISAFLEVECRFRYALSELERLRKQNQRLRQGLELTRMSVVLIMAREGCSLEIDRDAKLYALKEIDDALEDSE